MESTENQAKNFIARCEDLQKSQFILAPTKLADLLRTVASSPDILALFKEATDPFDYFAAQDKYFLPVAGKEDRAELVLPQDRQERLAFLFCLLTDIDSGKLNLSMFLHIFFDRDDGYSPAFTRFCSALIAPLETDVADALREGNVGTDALPRRREVVKAEAIALSETERRILALSPADQTDLSAGKAMLDEYVSALREERISTAQAVLLGYYYYTLYMQIEQTNALKLLRLTEELSS